MLEEEFLKLVSELLDSTKEDALKSARELYHSGAIDPENPIFSPPIGGSYVLPKLFMQAYADRMKYQWGMPDRKDYKRELKNIKNFV